MRISVFRSAHFNAAHRLHVPHWDEHRNRSFFGPCNNPSYHGHNYEVEIKVSGETDPETGMLIDLSYLRDLLRTEVEDRLDHKNLNLDVAELQGVNPTVENICFLIWKLLRARLDEQFDLQVRLYETPRNWAEYPA